MLTIAHYEESTDFPATFNTFLKTHSVVIVMTYLSRRRI